MPAAGERDHEVMKRRLRARQFADGFERRHGRLPTPAEASAALGIHRSTAANDLRTTGKPQGAVAVAPATRARIEAIVADPLPDEAVYPLVLYRGSLTVARAQALLGFTLAAKEQGVGSFTGAAQFSMWAYDVAHLCGLHAPVTAQGVHAFLSRLWRHPEVTKERPGLREYIREVFGSSDTILYRMPSDLEPIARWSPWSKRSWRRRAAPRAPRVEVPQFWPFLSDVPNEGHDLLMAIHGVVPKSLPERVRQDVCQDLAVSVLAGDVSLDNLRDAVPKHISAAMRRHPLKYGPISLDAPPAWSDDGRPLRDYLAASPEVDEWETG